MIHNTRDSFNLDAFLKGPPVVSDSTKACNHILKNIDPMNFQDPKYSELWQIILNPPSADLSGSLEDLIKSNPALLKSKVVVKESRNFIITPLIGAIFSGNIQNIKILLQHTKNINKADKEGYTAAHYAAMVSTHEVLNLFKKMGADFEQVNLAGASPSEFILHRFYHLPGVKDFNIYVDHTGPAYNHHFFLLKTKGKGAYLPHLVYTPEALLAMRVFGKGGFEDTSLNRQFTPHVYEQYLKKCEHPEEPLPIYMKSLEAKDNGKPVPEFLKGQYEVRARRDIQLGEFLIEYTGNCYSYDIEHDITSCHKRMALNGRTWQNLCVDAERGGSLAAYINDGPPNSMAIIFIHNGLPHLGIVALKAIERDETIRLLYGGDFFKKEKHVELAPKAIESYLEETKGLSEINPILFDYSTGQAISFTVTEQSLDFNSTTVSAEEELENLIKFRYHLGMVRYLITFETHLEKYIKKGLINPFILMNILNGLHKFNAIDRLGLDEETFITLYGKIAKWGKVDNKSKIEQSVF